MNARLLPHLRQACQEVWNRNRTAGEVRVLFRKGQLGGAGSVQWMFDRRGLVEATHAGGMDAEDAAIEAGAQEVRDGDGTVEFICDPPDVDAVNRAFTALGWVVNSAELAWIPKNLVTLDDDNAKVVAAFIGGLEENDDVHRIYVGLG